MCIDDIGDGVSGSAERKVRNAGPSEQPTLGQDDHRMSTKLSLSSVPARRFSDRCVIAGAVPNEQPSPASREISRFIVRCG